jgi:hypothetical protein
VDEETFASFAFLPSGWLPSNATIMKQEVDLVKPKPCLPLGLKMLVE